jgi:potassium-transporting ATPase KdpC subunit
VTALLRPALVVFVLLTLLTGVLYPLAVTGIAQGVFPDQANGSLVTKDGKTVGSSLLGQEFSAGDPKDAAMYFWGRPSATGPVPYTAFNADKGAGSTGSNLGPTNPALLDNVRARLDALNAADAAAGYARPAGESVPVDIVTASGSGLDPHISPAAAEYQVKRVAAARGLSEADVRRLVERYTEKRQLGILGEPRVNVLLLNLALGGR